MARSAARSAASVLFAACSAATLAVVLVCSAMRLLAWNGHHALFAVRAIDPDQAKAFMEAAIRLRVRRRFRLDIPHYDAMSVPV